MCDKKASESGQRGRRFAEQEQGAATGGGTHNKIEKRKQEELLGQK